MKEKDNKACGCTKPAGADKEKSYPGIDLGAGRHNDGKPVSQAELEADVAITYPDDDSLDQRG